MARVPAGMIKIRGPGHRRHLPFVMGGSIRIHEGEYVEAVSALRPLVISRRGLLLFIMPSAPTAWTPHPGVVSAGVLRFNRYRKPVIK